MSNPDKPRHYIPIRPIPPLPHASWVATYVPPVQGQHGPRPADAAKVAA